MWDLIKKILQKQGGTCIIVEDGRPVYVVTNFEEYENLLQNDLPEISLSSSKFEKAAAVASDSQLLEKINQEIENWKAGQVEQQAAEVVEEEEEEVKIEDLPI